MVHYYTGRSTIKHVDLYKKKSTNAKMLKIWQHSKSIAQPIQSEIF